MAKYVVLVASAGVALVLVTTPAAAQIGEDATPSPTASTVSDNRSLVEDTAAETAQEVVNRQLQQETRPLVTGWSLFALLVVVVVSGTVLLLTTVVRTSPSRGGAGPFRSQVEGMVLSMVVVAVIILGVTGKLTDEGLASVLAAIVGYAVGRSTSGDQTSGGGNREASEIDVTPPSEDIEPETRPLESATTPDPPDEPDVPMASETGASPESGRPG